MIPGQVASTDAKHVPVREQVLEYAAKVYRVSYTDDERVRRCILVAAATPSAARAHVKRSVLGAADIVVGRYLRGNELRPAPPRRAACAPRAT